MDLNPDLATFVKSGGFVFGLDLNFFGGVDLDLDLSFFKRVDLDLDLDLTIGLDLDLDLNITGFAHHWIQPPLAACRKVRLQSRDLQYASMNVQWKAGKIIRRKSISK